MKLKAFSVISEFNDFWGYNEGFNLAIMPQIYFKEKRKKFVSFARERFFIYLFSCPQFHDWIKDGIFIMKIVIFGVFHGYITPQDFENCLLKTIYIGLCRFIRCLITRERSSFKLATIPIVISIIFAVYWFQWFRLIWLLFHLIPTKKHTGF